MMTIIKQIIEFKTNVKSIVRRVHSNASTDTSSINSFTNRTHNCGQLNLNDVGKRVKLYGWLEKSSFNNKIIVLKDRYGSVQCVLNKRITSDFNNIRKKTIHLDSVLKICGLVRLRPQGKTNPNQSNGEIEIISDKVEIINPSKPSLPIQSKDHDITHAHRLKYRYLDIRRSDMQEALKFKSEFCQILRAKLTNLGFIDCETPTLFNRTPGGANEFIVPTQEPGKYYSLVQSPQQLKQLLMIGAIDRYFQICRCYRDETTRPDRQPEFTQVDIELSFTNQESVMNLIDHLLHHVIGNLSQFKTFSKDSFLSSYDDSLRLPRISFQDAFKFYGTDKPDTRFEWKIEDLDKNLQIKVPAKLDPDLFMECVKKCREKTKNDAVSSFILRSGGDESSLIQTLDKTDYVRRNLGVLRTVIAYELIKLGYQDTFKQENSFVWVTDFPLLTKNQCGLWEPTHHPFTAPNPQTISLIDSNIDQMIGQHYDLVLNGQEIAGGSIRIHDAELQSRIFKIIDVDCSSFSYFLDALDSGCPPHGGIAMGLDRLVAILLKRESIRETIAFPKSGLGRDLMTDSPHDLDNEVLKLYHQKIN